jgi:endo-1,4-beta-xylanase
MISLRSLACLLLSSISHLVTALPSPNDGLGLEELDIRQNENFITQYWGNDFADFEYESGPGGEYSLEWNQRAGGNFVVGKGYRPGGDRYETFSVLQYLPSFRL